MNLKHLIGLCAAMTTLSAAPAVASESNLTCSLEARGGGAWLEDYAIGHAECLSLTDASYTVSLDMSLQYQDDSGQWYDAHICGHNWRTASAVNGVAVAVADPLLCNYLWDSGIQRYARRVHLVVTESLDSDVRTTDSDPWVPTRVPPAARQ